MSQERTNTNTRTYSHSHSPPAECARQSHKHFPSFFLPVFATPGFLRAHTRSHARPVFDAALSEHCPPMGAVVVARSSQQSARAHARAHAGTRKPFFCTVAHTRVLFHKYSRHRANAPEFFVCVRACADTLAKSPGHFLFFGCACVSVVVFDVINAQNAQKCESNGTALTSLSPVRAGDDRRRRRRLAVAA